MKEQLCPQRKQTAFKKPWDLMCEPWPQRWLTYQTCTDQSIDKELHVDSCDKEVAGSAAWPRDPIPPHWGPFSLELLCPPCCTGSLQGFNLLHTVQGTLHVRLTGKSASKDGCRSVCVSTCSIAFTLNQLRLAPTTLCIQSAGKVKGLP